MAGILVIGFDDETLRPDTANRPSDVRSAFHLDKVQALISRHSHELFEIGVAFPILDGSEYPVIVVPEGVRSPVAAKADLFDGARKLVQHGDVYFRTLSSNGTPSTAVARPQDWADILEICFENREADIGRFLRRHLGGDLSSFVATLQQAARPNPPPPSLRERARELLQDGDTRFAAALAARPNNPQRLNEDFGTWSIAVVIDPMRPDSLPDANFFNVIAASNPNFTGWPPWFDSRAARDASAAPRVSDRAWEALIVSFEAWSNHVDFFRMDPRGTFFLARILQDDLSDRVQPMTMLDPILIIIRVADVMAVALSFARALGWDPDSTRLGFAFRWTRLQGRTLDCWSNPMVPISVTGRAHDDVAETFVEVPLITPANALAPYVEQAVRELFVLFGGYTFPTAATEEWVLLVAPARRAAHQLAIAVLQELHDRMNERPGFLLRHGDKVHERYLLVDELKSESVPANDLQLLRRRVVAEIIDRLADFPQQVQVLRQLLVR
jgi:hypothetical protein